MAFCFERVNISNVVLIVLYAICTREFLNKVGDAPYVPTIICKSAPYLFTSLSVSTFLKFLLCCVSMRCFNLLMSSVEMPLLWAVLISMFYSLTFSFLVMGKVVSLFM